VIEPQTFRKITAPALLLSGEKSYRFLGLIDEELTRLLPHARRIILPGATHRMWFEQPEACRNAVLNFLREEKAKALTTKDKKEHEGNRRNRPSSLRSETELSYFSPRLRVSAVKLPRSALIRVPPR
jgi:hypothetical protein